MPSSTRSSSSRRVSSTKRSRRSESSEMLIRRRPAAPGRAASERSVAPLVVSARSTGRRGAGAACSTRTGRWARTVGSPPVRRMLSKPKRSTHTRATRSISSKVSSSVRGSHCMPSSGMQYVQRKLQRSVTEIRRSRWTRPNESTRVPDIAAQATGRSARSAARRAGRRRPAPPAATPSPSGSTASALARAMARELVRALPARGPHDEAAAARSPPPAAPAADRHPDEVDLAVGPAVEARRRPRPGTGAGPAVGRVAGHPAQAGPGEQLEATPSTTPGCRAARTPALVRRVRARARRRAAWPA